MRRTLGTVKLFYPENFQTLTFTTFWRLYFDGLEIGILSLNSKMKEKKNSSPSIEEGKKTEESFWQIIPTTLNIDQKQYPIKYPSVLYRIIPLLQSGMFL